MQHVHVHVHVHVRLTDSVHGNDFFYSGERTTMETEESNFFKRCDKSEDLLENESSDSGKC